MKKKPKARVRPRVTQHSEVMDMLAAMAERMERIERVLWECIQYTPDGTAALEGGLVTAKEARELGYTANELREFARR